MVAEHNQHCEQTLMFTDIVGYSRLMGRNEAMAVEMLGDYRKILLSHIEQQGGHLVEFVGDAIFARFNSATSASAAAIAIQQHLQAFNEARDKKLPPLQTRIGLHKGEVMLRDGAVFGDSVNIAARLEPLAVPDGICISQTVYDEIRLTLSSPAKRLGTQTLKNIEQKVRVYLIKPSGIGWRDHLFYFLRGFNKKIVAYRYPLTACLLAFIVAGFYFIPRWLVPGYAANYVEIADFQNLMNEKGDADYFSAGITEAVRSQLADMRDVYIVDAKEGIHAPIRLEGSVQRLGDNLRIAYRLFRRKDNVQIAGGKLDGTYQDIFILQDRLVGEIARYLADEFDLQNFRPAPLRLTNDITAYDFYLKGMDYLDRPATHEHVDEAIKYFNTALVHDDKFASANAGICRSYLKKYELTNLIFWLNDAERFCLSALSLDSRSITAYSSIGAIYRDTGRYDEAIEILEKGLNFNTNSIDLLVNLASVYNFLGNKIKAESIYNDAINKDPKNWKGYSGYASFLLESGRYRESIHFYERALSITPENILALNNIAINYLYCDEYKRAADAFSKAAKVEPDSTIFANTGSMYYLSNDMDKAVYYYEQALGLQPENYQLMVYLADAYKFKSSKSHKSKEYSRLAIQHASSQLDQNENIAKAYQYMARAYALLGDLALANKFILKADEIEMSSAEALYSHLRIAVLEKNEDKIKEYALKLIKTEYSAKLLLSDPDFSILQDKKYKTLLVK